MPNTETPTLEKWLSHLTKIVGTPDENCYFVGHSLGCITILRYLETLKETQIIGGAILVAGFSHNLEYSGYKNELKSFFKTTVQWKAVQKHCKKFIVIHSYDNPWVPIKHADIFKDELHADTIKIENMKHFSGDDGIMELPIVLDKLIEISVSPRD